MTFPLRQTALLAALGCVPLMGLLVLPVMVGAFVDDLGMAESEAGWVSSAFFASAALGALVLAFRIHHVVLRRLARAGLVIMLLADAAAIAAETLPIGALVLLRLVSGLASAGVYGAVMGAYAGWREPDRAYGLFMAMQFAVSAAGLYGLPFLLPHLGLAGIFGLFALLDALGLLLVGQLPAPEQRQPRMEGLQLEWQVILTATALGCLLAIGLFETAQMGQFTYIERIGVTLALEPGEIGFALGLSSLLGIPAAFAVTAIGDRFGYFRPIAGAIAVQLLAVWILVQAGAFSPYLLAVILFAAGWAFVLPYFQAIGARLDPGGSVVVACGFATGAAGFLGPAGAAFLVRPASYTLLLAGVAACLLVVLGLTRFVTHRLAA